MKKKILLIDNDPTYLFILKQLLKKHVIVGETITAENGLEALKVLKRDYAMGKLPQIIISDIEMPVMCGISFLKELKAQELIDYTLTKIVLNSNNFRHAPQAWSIESPSVTFYQKPILDKQILTILSD